ncbi:MAG: hypothetical protein V1858_04455 [Candidatus Gottesmanbacteria bacterium]
MPSRVEQFRQERPVLPQNPKSLERHNRVVEIIREQRHKNPRLYFCPCGSTIAQDISVSKQAAINIIKTVQRAHPELKIILPRQRREIIRESTLFFLRIGLTKNKIAEIIEKRFCIDVKPADVLYAQSWLIRSGKFESPQKRRMQQVAKRDKQVLALKEDRITNVNQIAERLSCSRYQVIQSLDKLYEQGKTQHIRHRKNPQEKEYFDKHVRTLYPHSKTIPELRAMMSADLEREVTHFEIGNSLKRLRQKRVLPKSGKI